MDNVLIVLLELIELMEFLVFANKGFMTRNKMNCVKNVISNVRHVKMIFLVWNVHIILIEFSNKIVHVKTLIMKLKKLFV
jgi:hypothetical protein